MKIVNFVLGLATAVILAALIALGISAFYPAPQSPSYPNTAVVAPIVPCPSNDTVCAQNNAKIEAQQQAAQDQYNNAKTAYESAIGIYNRNLFIIANIVGIIFFAVGFWLVFGVALASNAVPVGIMLAGLWSIMYGYVRGWGSVDDKLKFFIGLVIAVLVIGGSMWLIQRHQKTAALNKIIMLNSDAKLNPNLFDDDVAQAPTRDGYGEGLVAAGDANKNVVALCADLTESTRVEAFAKKYPERFFELGVAEQNMATVAAGLGISGKIPFIASYATFSPGRNWEQIRTTIAYNDANVKIAGHHAGISVGPDGATHQATEDIAMMRALPNMKVFVPCDMIEARKATLAAARVWGPVYLRFQREKTPVMTTDETPFIPGKAEIFWLPGNGNARAAKADVLIIGCGGLLYNALLAARELEEEKIGAIVLNCSTIKPIDEKTIVELAKKIGAVVTVEEHQVQGGLGSAVAEVLAKHAPTPIEFIGMQNTFGESGQPEELIAKYGMGVKDIKAAAKRAIRRKNSIISI